MTKKFTEEQYNKLVEIQEGQYSDDLYFEPRSGNKAIEHVVEKNNPELHDFIEHNNLGNETVALMNTLTREWAHEQFVEKEKKYVWSSKKADRDSNVLTLYIDEYGMVSTSWRKAYEKNLRNENMLITETEIREWGYNPEMFDKKEVED